MKKLTMTFLAASLGLILAMPAFAFGPRDGRGPGPGYENPDYPQTGYGYGRIWERLNLSEEQKAKIEALELAHLKEIRPIKEKIFDKSLELRRLWLETDPDRNKINAKQKEVRALRDQLEDKQTAFRLEINKVLTPEQKEKLAAYGWGRKAGFGPRRGLRSGGGFGPGMCY